MTDGELIALDKMGFLPGPGEKEGEFLARVERTKKKFEEGEWIPQAHWEWTREFLDELFHVKPLYICAYYSKKGLAPWQGAASWIEGRELHSIQLQPGLRKGCYLGLYGRGEILAHEAVHAARSGFEESGAEEFFAYMTSERRWRRVLGPLVQKPWEVWPFLLGCLGGVVWPISHVLTTLWIGVGFFRLIRQHRRLKRASDHVLKRVGDPRRARAVLFRLTDEEICAFAKGAPIAGDSSLRWRVIRHYLEEPDDSKSCCPVTP